MQIKGTVHEVYPPQQVTDTIKKQEIIIEYAENPQYPEYLKFEAINAKTELTQDLAPGDTVEIDFNMKGRPWTDKTGKKIYFNTNQIWRVKCVSQAYQPVESGAPQYAPPVDLTAKPDEDDLPF